MLVNKIKHFGSSILKLHLAYENYRFKNELNICTYIPFLTSKGYLIERYLDLSKNLNFLIYKP